MNRLEAQKMKEIIREIDENAFIIRHYLTYWINEHILK
ncbi:DUF2179 domain-containing protein [Paenibacillus sp. FSL H8-0548]|nr:DUF2179 domain-containing protein [Paenibacillus sp. FSL H8-0548]